jgi:hypothetical protein
MVLAGYLAVGVAETWPRITYLDGRLPANSDSPSYLWGFWWMARQVRHLGNPWFTGYMAAPVGTWLGYHALLPLPGLLMTPLTLAFGPAVSFNLAAVALPGLQCYAMYRVARLWLRSQVAAIAAGAFYGLSSILTWQIWYHLNLAAGVLFVPLALEAAVRLRRRPHWGQAVILGVVLGASLLTDQESALLAWIIAALALLPWLAARPEVRKLALVAAAAVSGLVVATPQLIAMAQESAAGGGVHAPPHALAEAYHRFAVPLQALFAPSPRLNDFGLTSLGSTFDYSQFTDGLVTFGAVLSALALFGLVVARRRRNAWLLALLWLGAAGLALGPVLHVGSHVYVPLAQSLAGTRVSAVMPYTWFVRIPGTASFREADRFLPLGLVPAALLAGSAVEWLLARSVPALVAVLALAVLEAGWSSTGVPATPAALPALARPIAASQSSAIVVDVPFGLRGGIASFGSGLPLGEMVLATADGHPQASSYTSRLATNTITRMRRHAFYRSLVAIQHLHRVTTAQVAAARRDARAMRIGWVLVWTQEPGISRYLPAVTRYLHETGFRFDYRADGVAVYRPATVSGSRGRP